MNNYARIKQSDKKFIYSAYKGMIDKEIDERLYFKSKFVFILK